MFQSMEAGDGGVVSGGGQIWRLSCSASREEEYWRMTSMLTQEDWTLTVSTLIVAKVVSYPSHV